MIVKAHFDGKVFVPDEPIDLPAGTPLVITVLNQSRKQSSAKRKPPRKTLKPRLDEPDSAARKKSLLDWIVENRVKDDDLPVDLAHQHDHYLYGTSKKKPANKKRRKK